ncbi:MAG: AAA family ATPase [Acidaminococcaceae bacterium]|jgi:putative ATP-dependent endonuclease of OLD family|nr:AAA family ATPase [Acidaminococcaceae bacterium]
MYVHCVRVKNYRSFADVTMYFNEQANYLVGENSIGKSSVLKLLSMLASGTGLDETDYADPARPVVVIADIVMHGPDERFVDEQAGQENRVRLRFEKKVEEICPRLYNDENGQMLPLNLIRRFRYIFHSSVMPEQHILTAHIHKMLERQLEDLCGKQLDMVIPKEVWAFAQQQELHGNYDASYYMNILYLSRLLSRQDRPLADNMKFISIVALKIIAQVELMYHSHAVPFNHGLVRGADGKIYLPLIIAIDEPEIHLQPYLQRSILTYYKQLLRNEDPAFCQLLQKLFQVDGLQGQLFIVTHSTDSLVDDYRNIVRFYRDERNRVCAACGATFHFSEEIQKHLIMHFPEIKEALYSRSVIIVEGETEYGCFNMFGTTLGIRFDYYGICLINARGESSIGKIRTLLRSFKIPVVCLYDADVREFRQQNDPCVFFTDEICFEMDLVKAMLDHGRRKLLDEIICNVGGMPGRATGDMLRKACHKLNKDRQEYPSCDLAAAQPRLPDTLYVYYFAWLYSNKGVVLGRLLGESLRANEIPPAFVRVIQAAGKLAKVNNR